MIASGALLLAPAVAAVSGVSMTSVGSFGTDALNAFTPANADPKMTAAIASSKHGLAMRGLSFTPRAGLDTSSRAITVAVHARPLDLSGNLQPAKTQQGEMVSSRAPLAIAPVRYSLGSSIGWKSFAEPSRVAEVDRAMAAKPKDKPGTTKPSRWNGALEVDSVPAVSSTPKGLDRSKNVELDVSGSYSITRNLDVKAGVKYKADRDRFELPENEKDSQAVYVGTAFRF